MDIGVLTNATILLMIVLMFIGASPGSTGGGVKTTSAALLVMLMWNRLKGNEDVNIFNRTSPKRDHQPDHLHHLCFGLFSCHHFVGSSDRRRRESSTLWRAVIFLWNIFLIRFLPSER